MVLNSWAVCLVVSIGYLLLFFHVAFQSNDGNDDGDDITALLFGFCVWGTPDLPDEKNGCFKQQGEWKNSHSFAFLLDVSMTMAVVLLYNRYNQQQLATKNQAVSATRKRLFAALGGIIFAHGLLHFLLYDFIDCYHAPHQIYLWIKVLGFLLFGIFAFALCMIILGLGFAGSRGWDSVQKVSMILTIVIVSLVIMAGIEWILPALFCIAHPLSSVTALLSQSTIFTQPMGWVFLVATFMGILELSQCPNLYRPVGGHVW